MKDLFFNINTRDISTTEPFTTNPSVQNAGILKEARCFSPLQPVWGIGLGNIINGPVQNVNFEMNRWKDQIQKDGGKGRFTINTSNDGANTIVSIDIQAAY